MHTWFHAQLHQKICEIGLGDQLLLKVFFENLDFLSTLFLKCAQFLSPLFIILVVLTVTLFSEKMLIFH